VAAGSLNFSGMRTCVRIVYGIGRLLALCRQRPVGRGVFPLQKILSRHDGFSIDFAHCEVESHTSGEPPAIMVERPIARTTENAGSMSRSCYC
jgi:hypothetical protein